MGSGWWWLLAAPALLLLSVLLAFPLNWLLELIEWLAFCWRKCPQCGQALAVPPAATVAPAPPKPRSWALIVGAALGAVALFVLVLVAAWIVERS